MPRKLKRERPSGFALAAAQREAGKKSRAGVIDPMVSHFAKNQSKLSLGSRQRGLN